MWIKKNTTDTTKKEGIGGERMEKNWGIINFIKLGWKRIHICKGIKRVWFKLKKRS